MAQTLTVGLLIVSTTAAQDPTTDAAGPLLRDFFASVDAGSASWSVTDTQIVTDDNAAIQERVRYWADEMKLNLIVTTGGTGFAVSDGTPEACSITGDAWREGGGWGWRWRWRGLWLTVVGGAAAAAEGGAGAGVCPAALMKTLGAHTRVDTRC